MKLTAKELRVIRAAHELLHELGHERIEDFVSGAESARDQRLAAVWEEMTEDVLDAVEVLERVMGRLEDSKLIPLSKEPI